MVVVSQVVVIGGARAGADDLLSFAHDVVRRMNVQRRGLLVHAEKNGGPAGTAKSNSVAGQNPDGIDHGIGRVASQKGRRRLSERTDICCEFPLRANVESVFLFFQVPFGPGRGATGPPRLIFARSGPLTPCV